MDFLTNTIPKIADDFDEDIFLNCMMPIAMEIGKPIN